MVHLESDGATVVVDPAGSDERPPAPKRVMTIPPPRGIVAAVERVSRLKFRNPPPVFAVSDEQMRGGYLSEERKDAILKTYLNVREGEASLLLQGVTKELNVAGRYTPGNIILRSPPAPESLSDEAFLESRLLRRLLAHELAHAIVDQNYGFCRVWSAAGDCEYRRVLGFLDEAVAESVSGNACGPADSREEADAGPVETGPEKVLKRVLPQVMKLETLVMCLQDREQSPCRLFHPGSPAEPPERASLRGMLDGLGEKWPDYILERGRDGLLDAAKDVAARLAFEEDQEKVAPGVTLLRNLRHGLGVRLLHRGDIAKSFEFPGALECRSWVMRIVYLESPEALDSYLRTVVRGPSTVSRGLGESAVVDEGKLAVAEGAGIDMVKHRLVIRLEGLGPGDRAAPGPLTVNTTTLWASRGRAVLHAGCSGLSEDELRRVGAFILEAAKRIGP